MTFSKIYKVYPSTHQSGLCSFSETIPMRHTFLRLSLLFYMSRKSVASQPVHDQSSSVEPPPLSGSASSSAFAACGIKKTRKFQVAPSPVLVIDVDRHLWGITEETTVQPFNTSQQSENEISGVPSPLVNAQVPRHHPRSDCLKACAPCAGCFLCILTIILIAISATIGPDLAMYGVATGSALAFLWVSPLFCGICDHNDLGRLEEDQHH